MEQQLQKIIYAKKIVIRVQINKKFTYYHTSRTAMPKEEKNLTIFDPLNYCFQPHTVTGQWPSILSFQLHHQVCKKSQRVIYILK